MRNLTSERLTHKPILAVVLSAISLSACSPGQPKTANGASGDNKASAVSLSEDEKHRLYSAALAASETPLESEIFKDVCRRIGICDASGKPNDNYMAFVSAHVDWAMKAQPEQFKAEIRSREKASDYINQHLPR